MNNKFCNILFSALNEKEVGGWQHFKPPITGARIFLKSPKQQLLEIDFSLVKKLSDGVIVVAPKVISQKSFIGTYVDVNVTPIVMLQFEYNRQDLAEQLKKEKKDGK